MRSAAALRITEPIAVGGGDGVGCLAPMLRQMNANAVQSAAVQQQMLTALLSMPAMIQAALRDSARKDPDVEPRPNLCGPLSLCVRQRRPQLPDRVANQPRLRASCSATHLMCSKLKRLPWLSRTRAHVRSLRCLLSFLLVCVKEWCIRLLQFRRDLCTQQRRRRLHGMRQTMPAAAFDALRPPQVMVRCHVTRDVTVAQHPAQIARSVHGRR